jgi:hypothetical protein
VKEFIVGVWEEIQWRWWSAQRIRQQNKLGRAAAALLNMSGASRITLPLSAGGEVVAARSHASISRELRVLIDEVRTLNRRLELRERVIRGEYRS